MVDTMVGWSNQITDWWYGKTFAGIALFVLVNDEVRRTASDVAEHLETKIDQVPDRVVEKIQTTDGNGSSIVKAVTDTPPVE
jgi:hypothetical protein